MEAKRLLSAKKLTQAIKKGVSLVDFTAPWCAPCREQEPIIRRLAGRFKEKALIAEVNVDKNQEIVVKLGIHSIPTLVVFKNGKEIQRFVGLQAEDILERAILNTLN